MLAVLRLGAAVVVLAWPFPALAARVASAAHGGSLRSSGRAGASAAAGRAVGGRQWAAGAETWRESLESSQLAFQATGLDSCDVTSQGPVCFSGQRSMLVPTAVPSGLVGHWTFDERIAYDSSGRGNHGTSEIMHGPSPPGGGHSALFQKSFMTVPNAKSLQLVDFTYTFWVYTLEDSAALADTLPPRCPLLRKGIYLPKAEEFANAPAILFNYRTGQLRASVTTTSVGRGDGEFMDSSARLAPGRWAHVALVHHGARQSLLLYVNGMLDSTLRTRGSIVQNDFPLYVGGDPFTADVCKHGVYLDELRVLSRAAAPHELQAEAAPALAGVDPSFVRLGCLRCSLQEAMRVCPRGSHICSSLELHTGGYEAARALGWLAKGTHVWTEAAIAKAHNLAFVNLRSQSGLGLCCRGQL